MTTEPLDFVDPGTAFSLVGALYILMALAAGVHVVLNKQNEAAAFSWLGIIVLAPLLGAVLYWLFGINRIRRRAQAELPGFTVGDAQRNSQNIVDIGDVDPSWASLMRLGSGVHQSPYLSGNRVVPMINGDEAYPAMIGAIRKSHQSVVLSSYIFEYDSVGREFVNALVDAKKRGVSVRVLIDGLGVGYGFSFVRSDRVLRKQGVATARFLSALSTTGTRFINLRNHRKILSVDGEVAFVGGMNIRESNVLEASGHVISADVAFQQATPRGLWFHCVQKFVELESVLRADHSDLTQDVHFKVEGPVISQINAVFEADWYFAARERLHLPCWPGGRALSGLGPDLASAVGAETESESAMTPASAVKANDVSRSVVSRVLLDGPDDNYQKLQMTMLGAIQVARHQIFIVSPYFLPGQKIISALHLAVLRGVQVNVCVPRRNNLPFIGWAMRANRSQLLDHGVRLYESPSPFDHSKLFLVDSHWSMIGSSNWDARSLELNFEINLECYDTAFNREIADIIDRKLEGSMQITSSVEQHILKRLRNNFFRLLSPYL